MKKKMIAMFLATTMVMSLTACGSTGTDTEASSAETTESAGAEESTESAETTEEAPAEGTTSELTDGKFAETRKITVEVYDRGNDGGSDPTNNKYTEYIKKGMLEKHNVEVEFVAVPRWTEVEQLNNLLAAGDAPDICVTYDYATIQTYANMGGVLNLQPYVDDYAAEAPNLWNWLTDYNIYYDQDPDTKELWAIEGKLANSNRVLTFVRQDWLDALGLKAPTTKAEFEEMLIAFRDNADKLLGADADKMIPYSVSYDVGWRAATLIESFIDPNITDKELYVNGFDDRKLTQNGTKEAVRLLNKWYNEGLMWDDFALYGSGDTTEDDMIKAGYVGAFTHNWDYPWRNGEDSIAANLVRLVGADAKYVAIDCFENANGEYAKYVNGTAGDRKIFFPGTNDEPLASLLYLDFISTPEVIEYLQIGDEGVTHNTLDDGGVEIIAATGDDIQNSGFNLDYTITCNGMNLTDAEKTAKSLAHSYAGVDADDVNKANELAKTNAIPAKNFKTGEIVAENGMGTPLAEKRDIAYDTAVSASVEKFDSVWDAALADYLGAGGQAIMDERAAAWDKTYGDATELPE